MKIAVAWCGSCLLALGIVPISRAEGSADIEKAIATLENQWAQAERTNNADQLVPLFADKFMITESDGRVVDRATFLAEEKSSHYSRSDIEGLKVTVFGDTAIANYALHQAYTNNGKAHDTQVQETDTWVKMPNGAWQCVASHGTTIKKT